MNRPPYRRLDRVLLTLVAFTVTSASSIAQNSPDPPVVQSVGTPPAAVQWQIKGTGTVTGVPNAAPYDMEIQFQKKAAGAANWTTMFTVHQYGKGGAGAIRFDAGFQNMTAAAQGDSYRIRVTTTYTDANGLPQTIAIADSTSVTPIP